MSTLAAEHTMVEAGQGQRKEKTGVVVSNKMVKTVVVHVEKKHRHAKYGKVISRREKYYAHDEHNEAQPGDTVVIQETRPLSKLKRWRVYSIVKKGNHAAPVSAIEGGEVK